MKRSGASLALSAVLAFGAAGEAKAGSWDEKVFASHVDFDAVARAGESAVPLGSSGPLRAAKAPEARNEASVRTSSCGSRQTGSA